MTVSTTIHPSSKKQNTRPTLWRLAASKYVDLLFAVFIAWITCFAFGWKGYWATVALFLWVAETLWCRDRLHPTAGEFCLGIRYLTSSSSQVVADIQVVHPKLKLNGFLVAAGVLEVTLAVVFLSGWTFLEKAAGLGMVLAHPFSMLFWSLAGLGFFTCGGLLLGGSRNALWAVPLLHLLAVLDLRLSYGAWQTVLQQNALSPKLLERIPVGFHFWEACVLWGVLLTLGLFFSKKQLVN